MKDLYRLYIDEVGNHDIRPDIDENERFLTLFGVIVNGQYMADIIQPQMQQIKREFFVADPDEPVIFHRKEITRFQGPFKILYSDKEKRQQFGDLMLEMYEAWEYVAITVTIDKLTHYNSYSVWRYEPYHYCLAAMLERYVLYLHYRQIRGDVMIEARGTKPDQKLRRSFLRLWNEGTENIQAHRMQSCLTSKKLKIKQKAADIAGLQMADLLGHAAHYDHLAEHRLVAAQKSAYSRQIAEILNRSKYNRSKWGQIRGYGKKFLP